MLLIGLHSSLSVGGTWLILLCISALSAQDLPCRIRNLTVTDGLSNPSVMDIAEDARAYLWLATNDGLNRYDGIGLRSYFPSRQADPTASTRELPVLHSGDSGALWLCYHQAADKLFRYDALRDTFHAFATRGGRAGGGIPADAGVTALYEQTDEYLWVATSNAGLFRYDLSAAPGDTIGYRWYRASPGDTNALPTDLLGSGICQDKSGRLWLASEEGLVGHLPGDTTFVTYRWSEREAGNEVLGLTYDTLRRCLWVSTFYGLLRFDPAAGTSRLIPTPAHTSPADLRYVTPPVLDKRGRIWVNAGSYPAGLLWVYSPAEDRFLRPAVTTAEGTTQLTGATRLYPGSDGRIWSGGFRRGVQIIDPSPPNVRRIDLEGLLLPGQTFTTGEITAIAGGGPGIIYLGTAKQGVWRWSLAEERLTLLFRPPSGGSELVRRIFGLVRSPDGKSLFATAGQVVYRIQLSTGSIRAERPLTGLPNHALYLTARCVDQRLWLSCFSGGIVALPLSPDGETLRFVNGPGRETPAFGSITDIQPGTRPGQLWLSSVFAGVVEWDEQTGDFTEHPLNCTIRRFFVAADGTLWLATDAGLLHYDPEARQVLTDPALEELAPRIPRALVQDEAGLLWVAGEKGLVALDPRTAEVRHQLFANTWLDTNEEWYAHEMFAYRDTATCKLFFANQRGLFLVDPAEIRSDTVPPTVVLQEVSVNGERRALPAENASFTLAHNQNDLRFSVAALHFQSPRRNQLRYRLEGFDAAWRSALPGQSLEYPNLPPGGYRLLIRAGNPEGVWTNERPVALFRVSAPWYANPYAYALYLLGFLGLVYSLFRQQLARKRQAAERQYLEELDTAKAHLFTNISHEFRTPLTLILGDGKLLRGKLGAQLQAPAARIIRSGERLLWLVNQLLELAQADSGFLRLQPKQADIIPFLRYSLQSFASLADPRGIELRFRSVETERWMDYDPERLHRVLNNLLANAIKFTPDGGWIEMRADYAASHPGPTLRITVTDSGPGIPPEDLARIFDRFHRATSPQGGAGIGLALAKEIVDLMDGDLRAENAASAGAMFILRLPVSQNAPRSSPAAALNGAVPVGDSQYPVLGQTEPRMPLHVTPAPLTATLPHILIIEDNDDLRPFLRACLDDHYHITLARDGIEGLELTDQHAFDLIVSDVMMPRMDGFTVCRRLREQPETSHLPVILLTARVDMESRLEGLSRGADAYLPKPFDPRELRTRCAQLLEQRNRLRTYYRSLLITDSPDDNTAPQEEQAPEHAFVILARAAVVDRLADPDFSVDDLARAVHLSRYQLHRKLQQLVGMNTSRFIRTIRLQHAQTLLRDPARSIASVAYDCGFRDPDYFSRVFREAFDCSPTDFRR